MSSPASDRPLDPKKTNRPYSTLEGGSPRQTDRQKKGNRETGPRLKQTSVASIETEVPAQASTASIPSESLQRPFASLVPQKKILDASDPSIHPPPQPPVPVWDEVSSPSHATGRARAFCKMHRIAKNNQGECMMCLKEGATKDSGLAWKLIVTLMIVAVVVGGAVAVTL